MQGSGQDSPDRTLRPKSKLEVSESIELDGDRTPKVTGSHTEDDLDMGV
jgi:hypothetical protein